MFAKFIFNYPVTSIYFSINMKNILELFYYFIW